MDSDQEESEESFLRERTTNNNFAAMFHSILSNERPHPKGYEKLESEETRSDRVGQFSFLNQSIEKKNRLDIFFTFSIFR